MSAPAPIRVAQWGTGNTGAVALAAVLEHPDLELTGLWVARPDNAGRDAAELAGPPGMPATGIVASTDPAVVLASAPQCICYMASDRGRAEQVIDDICGFLAAGISVVATTMPLLVHPGGAGEAVRDRLAGACAVGRSSFLCTGIEPGFMADALVLQLSSLSRSITGVHVQEAMNVGGYRVHEWRSGLGRTLAEDAEQYQPGHIARGWTGVMMLLADGLGVALDAVREHREVAVGGRAFEVPAGNYGADDIAALRFEVVGEVDGEPRLVVEHCYRLLDDVAPHWPQPVSAQQRTTRIAISGQPDIDATVALGGAGLDPTGQGVLGTAMRAVNAIPVLMAAPPGVHSCLDLPLVTGRHSLTR